MIIRLLQVGGCLAATIAMALPTASAQDFVANGDGAQIPDFVEGNVPGISGVSTASIITITEEDALTIGDLVVCIDGLSHTWLGDLVATITHQPAAGSLDQETRRATLFNRVGRGVFPGDGDASNFDGDYEFASTGADLWVEAAQGSSGNQTQTTVDDDFVVSPQRYGIVNQNGDLVPQIDTLAEIFGGRSSQGTWRINFRDDDINDVGSFTGTSIKFTSATAVPEPGTFGLMAVASIGGFFYVRRKKKQSSTETSKELSS